MKVIHAALVALLVLAAPTPAQAPRVERYGAGCGGAFLDAEPPRLGARFWVYVMSTDAPAVSLVVGFAPVRVSVVPVTFFDGTQWMTTPCSIYVWPAEVIVFPGLAQSRRVSPFVVPRDRSVLGRRFYLQSTSPDSHGLSLSNGLACTVGA